MVDPDQVFKYEPKPTAILAQDSSGRIWQRWQCPSTLKSEWRPLPSLDDAHALYGGVLNP